MLVIVLLVVFFTDTAATNCDWEDVERGIENMIPFNPNTDVLQIKTNHGKSSESGVESWKLLSFGLKDEQQRFAGNISLYFKNDWKVVYDVGCDIGYQDFPVSLPEEQEKTWQFYINPGDRGPGAVPQPRIIIKCNGVKVLDKKLDEKTCEKFVWVTWYYTSQATMLHYPLADSASQSYCMYSVYDWGDWGDWGVCSSNCFGTQHRTRICEDTVIGGAGFHCLGEGSEKKEIEDSETQHCNENVVCPDWISVPSRKYDSRYQEVMSIIDFDLQHNALQIRSDSATWIWDQIYLYFYEDYEYTMAGGLHIYRTNPMRYQIIYCMEWDRYTEILTKPPADPENEVWTIFRTDTSLQVECNGVLLIDYNISQCTNTYKDVWENEVRQIEFGEVDTLSDEYRAGPSVCEAGEYKSGDMIGCTPCPGNTYSTIAATSCTDCPEGSVSNTDKTDCIQCPAGEYRNKDVTECTTCTDNTISDQPGTASCTPCEPGTVANTDNTLCGLVSGRCESKIKQYVKKCLKQGYDPVKLNNCGDYSDYFDDADSDEKQAKKCKRMERALIKKCDGRCRLESDEPECPADMPEVSCTVNACDFNECPDYPEANCEHSSCGGCFAIFYHSNGEEIADCGEAEPECPVDAPLVNCVANPCDVEKCPNYPDADLDCEANFCGGCNAIFYDSNGDEVTDCHGGERVLDSWCQHDAKYLEGYSSGKKRYPSLNEAQEQCLTRDDCSGVTYEPENRKYSLRKGTELLDSDKDDENTWVRCYSGDGNWSEWSVWSECSKECDGGIQLRSRTCTNPAPVRGGLYCEGRPGQMQDCNQDKPCPVDGNWSDYGDWSDCSAECDGGSQTRSRSCSNPAPSNGGAKCEGSRDESMDCNDDPCPTERPGGVSQDIEADLSCDFESDTCKYTHGSDDAQFSWVRNSGRTHTSDTGPDFDHTSGEGYYMYIESSSPRVEGDKAVLVSPWIEDEAPCTLQFYTYMRGSSMGEFNMYIEMDDGTRINKVKLDEASSAETTWKLNLVKLRGIEGRFRILFEGVRGRGIRGDIGLDDIRYEQC